MKTKILKKVLAIMAVIMLISTDLSILGEGLISYAVDSSNTTNNANIEFLAYFKNDEGEKRTNIQKSIKDENIKMYVEVKVKNEGYLVNGAIELQESNFRIKENILSNNVISIKDNKVNLNQINAGETAIIELDIEPITVEKLTTETLSKTTTVKLTGTYMETSYKGLNIEGTSNVTASFKPDETMNAELTTKIITNQVINNKRILQIYIKSRLEGNEFPIKQTTINVEIPKISNKEPERITIDTFGTKATNNNTTISEEQWKYENDILTITLKNEGQDVYWNKDVYDEIIVALEYPEDVDGTERIVTKTNSEILVHNSESKYMARYEEGIENNEFDNSLLIEEEFITKEIYKGQLYANINAENKKNVGFETKTTIKVAAKEYIDSIKITDEDDQYISTTNQNAKTKYTKTEINKDKMLEILGINGSIKIVTNNKEYTINRGSEQDENGNIVINYEEETREIEIITSKPEKIGKLEIYNTKEIEYNSESQKSLKEIKGIVSTKNIEESLGKIKDTATAEIELKEPITKAELSVSKDQLLTTTENNNVVFGIKLITNGSQYELYKNPKIQIKLPEDVEEVSVNSNPSKTNANEFENIAAKYDKNTKTITIELTGEQTEYPVSEASQAYLQLDLNIKLAKLATSKQDQIIMTYTNENVIPAREEVTIPVNIIAPSGLITVNNLPTYNVESISGISNNNQTVQILSTDAGKELTYNTYLLNNTGYKLTNVKVIGKLPTDGNKFGEETNTLTTKLKSLIANNAEIYYTENQNATTDTEKAENGWTTNLSSLQNARLYLIKLVELDKEQRYEVSFVTQLLNPIQKDTISRSEYEVIYDTEIENDKQVKSTIIELQAPTAINIETNLTAQVGNDTIKNSDTVKTGEVIKYIATVKNNGKQEIKNVVLKANVPTGTVVVTPQGDYVHSGTSYYNENTSITEIVRTVPELAVGETYTTEFEVRVKQDTANGTEISNKTIATCESETVESSELKVKVETATLRVTVKQQNELGTEIVSGKDMRYMVFVENLSNEAVKNLELKATMENINISYAVNDDEQILSNVPEKLTIKEIPANGIIFYQIGGMVNEGISNVSAIAVLKDANGKEYRSNKITNEVTLISGKIVLSSNKDKATLGIGETVEYNIKAINTGNTTQEVIVADDIPEELIVQSISENGTIIIQTTNVNDKNTYVSKISNNTSQMVMLEPNQEVNITIIAKNQSQGNQTKTIKNKAEMKMYGITKAVSEEVTHILTPANPTELKNIITGVAWIDSNINGQKDFEEQTLSNIKVRIYDVSTSNFLKYDSGNIIETATNEKGEYKFTQIKNGNYIIVFEYDTNKYEPTLYKNAGVDDSKNSNVVAGEITINGQTKTYALTDTINLTDNIFDINIGLRDKKIFDMELNKYISRITVQNNSGTKTYTYKDSSFEKLEIHRKQFVGSLIVFEYTIRVKNNGEIPGMVNKIVDYLPNEMTFSSELNPNWYIQDNSLYTKAFENTILNPGESKDIKLILTKTMTNENAGLINNRAEIVEGYNELGNKDIDSTPNNQLNGEDDIGSVDVIIGVKTGGTTIIYTILMLLNTILIIIAVRLILKNSKKTTRKSIMERG